MGDHGLTRRAAWVASVLDGKTSQRVRGHLTTQELLQLIKTQVKVHKATWGELEAVSEVGQLEFLPQAKELRALFEVLRDVLTQHANGVRASELLEGRL